MTGKNINTMVNRAFTIFGLLFFVGGVYLGTLIFVTAPEVYTINGLIESVRVEKTRPLGFEDIPVDTDNPDYAHIPINVNTYGLISYTFNSQKYKTEILSWYEDNDWNAGETRTFFLIEGEEDIPYETLPGEVSGKKKEGLLIGLAMSFMGLILFFVSLWQKRRARRSSVELLDKVKKLKNRNYSPFLPRGNKILYEIHNRGSFFIGGILTVIGSIFLGVGIGEVFSQGEIEMKMMLAFPALIGLGLLYMGLSEFTSDWITIGSREVRVIHKALWGRYNETRLISSFAGIDENILEREVPGSIKRHIYKEQVLIHEDKKFNELSIKLIPDDAKAHEESKLLAQVLNLPRIIRDDQKIYLEYPEGEILKEDSSLVWDGSSWNQNNPFPGKYLKLIHFNGSSLKITRPYWKSMIWGVVILSGGGFVAFFAGNMTVLFPFVVMGLIFLGIGLKKEVFEIRNSVLTMKRSFAGKLYRSQKIHLSDIQELIIGNDPRVNNAKCIEIVGNQDRILFGQAAGDAELNWIKECLEFIKKSSI
jgi:hypothetical protein